MIIQKIYNLKNKLLSIFHYHFLFPILMSSLSKKLPKYDIFNILYYFIFFFIFPNFPSGFENKLFELGMPLHYTYFYSNVFIIRI